MTRKPPARRSASAKALTDRRYTQRIVRPRKGRGAKPSKHLVYMEQLLGEAIYGKGRAT